MENNIKKFRTKKGWSQNELAKLAGMTDVAISRAEHGTLKLSVDACKELALIFNCTLDELLKVEK